jgi:ElaB/YqjD/DUF883 family membrane-anchored ribosome-binding protein
MDNQELLQAIEQMIDAKLKPMNDRFDKLEQDIQNVRSELKDEIQNVRTELKDEIQNVRTELKEDIQEVRTDLQDTRTELKMETQAVYSNLSKEVENVRLLVENVTNKKIDILAEGHQMVYDIANKNREDVQEIKDNTEILNVLAEYHK